MSKYELTFRRTKGSPVTSDEIDRNFRNIKLGHDDHENRLSVLESVNTDYITDDELIFQVARLDTKINNLLTTDIAEGENYYYTNERVAEYLSENNYVTKEWINQQDFGSLDDIAKVNGTDAFNARFDNRILQVIGNNLDLSFKNSNELREGTDNSVGETEPGLGDGRNNLFYTTERAKSSFDEHMSASSTDVLSEGNANLYYTNTRVQEYLDAQDYTKKSYVDYRIEAFTDVSQETLTEIRDLVSEYQSLASTDGLTEGTTNLFYTTERANIAFDEHLETKTTDNLLEGTTNLYWSEVRGTENFNTNLSNSDTGDLTEGANLYYTDERSRLAISVDGDLDYNSETGIISYNMPTEISFSTLIEKPNTASGYGITDVFTKEETNTLITNRIVEISAGDIELTGYATESYVKSHIDSKTTNDFLEGTDNSIGESEPGVGDGTNNLFYTQTRFDNSFSDKSTDDLLEGVDNLYYTDSRVIDLLAEQNIPNKDWVISKIITSVDGNLFSPVAISGSYNDLVDTPTKVSDFSNDSNFISLSNLSASGDILYNNTTGEFSFTQDKSYSSLVDAPTNVSHFTNDSQYLVDSDIRDEITSITNRLDTLEVIEYTIFDVFRNLYDSTVYTIEDGTIEFRIKAIDTYRFAFLGSGQSDSDWDTMVDAVYGNDIVTITNFYNNLTDFEKFVIQAPYLALLNSDVLLINDAFNKTYETLTMNTLLDPTELAAWQQRNAQMFIDMQTFNSKIPTDNTIKNILKNNSYADFARDTVVSGWNPS